MGPLCLDGLGRLDLLKLSSAVHAVLVAVGHVVSAAFRSNLYRIAVFSLHPYALCDGVVAVHLIGVTIPLVFIMATNAFQVNGHPVLVVDRIVPAAASRRLRTSTAAISEIGEGAKREDTKEDDAGANAQDLERCEEARCAGMQGREEGEEGRACQHDGSPLERSFSVSAKEMDENASQQDEVDQSTNDDLSFSRIEVVPDLAKNLADESHLPAPFRPAVPARVWFRPLNYSSKRLGTDGNPCVR